MKIKPGFKYVTENITGRVAMSEMDADLLQQIAAKCKTWCEIGTLWGGSAILAALANPKLIIYCVDPLMGYHAEIPRPQDVLNNFMRFNVNGRIELIRASSDPWPFPEERRFDAVFIDGLHDPDSVRHDLGEAFKVADKYILIHDWDDPDVAFAAGDVIDKHPDWYYSSATSRMITLEYDPDKEHLRG